MSLFKSPLLLFELHWLSDRIGYGIFQPYVAIPHSYVLVFWLRLNA
jgi:hypothetical protein